MRVFRCYFLNERDRIEDYENIEALALDEAVDRSLALLRQRREHKESRSGKGRTDCIPLGEGSGGLGSLLQVEDDAGRTCLMLFIEGACAKPRMSTL